MIKRRLRYAWVLVLLLGSLSLAPVRPDDLKTRIEQIIRKSGLKKARIGIVAFSTKENKRIYERMSSSFFSLASNTKLITTSAALFALGPDFKLTTTVATTGKIMDHHLTGDLIIIGGGDPSISGRLYKNNPTAVFESWADHLLKNKITTIDGNLILDDSLFTPEIYPQTWKGYDKSRWWAAPVSALPFNDDCLDVIVRPAKKAGLPGIIETSPATDYLSFDNKTRTTGKKGKRGAGFSRKNKRVRVTGYARLGTLGERFPVTVDHPTRFFGHVLAQTLKRKGITLSGKILYNAPYEGETLLTTTTHTLLETAKITNFRSQNLYAECTFRLMGAIKSKEGSFRRGASAVRQALKEMGFHENYRQVDGSGLSRENKMTPLQMVRLLKTIRSSRIAKVFRSTLPISGTRGSLRNRMKSRGLKGRVIAKTGHINSVSTLSGIIKTDSGDELIFSILINGYKGSSSKADRLENRICEALVKE